MIPFLLVLLLMVLIIVGSFMIHPILGAIAIIYFVLQVWKAVQEGKEWPPKITIY